MADTEAKKIQAGVWASGPTADRTDPDDASLNPALVRTIGYPSPFSAQDGNTPRRRVVNQKFREWDGHVLFDMQYGGVHPYDAEVNYRQYAHCTVGVDEYVCNAANGPATSNATSPTDAGQTIWSRVSGEINPPSAPNAPTAVAGNRTLFWSWNCPLDGGQVLTGFTFRWRRAGTMPWTTVAGTLTGTYYELDGLTNGVNYEAQVMAHTAANNSEWSDTGTAAPAAVAPSRVVGVVATSGEDGEIPVRWETPDNGGADITRYDIEWKSGTQAYDSARRVTSMSNSVTIPNLVNGTEYDIRVRAVNPADTGAWSDDASATPAEPAPPPPAPDPDTAPLQVPAAPTGAVFGHSILWEWQSADDGGQRVTGAQIQWREQGDAWEDANIVSVTSGCYFLTGLDAGTTYEARVREINSIGTAMQWSATGSASTNAEGGGRAVNGSGNFIWPWDTPNGIAFLKAGDGGGGGGGAGGHRSRDHRRAGGAGGAGGDGTLGQTVAILLSGLSLNDTIAVVIGAGGAGGIHGGTATQAIHGGAGGANGGHAGGDGETGGSEPGGGGGGGGSGGVGTTGRLQGAPGGTGKLVGGTGGSSSTVNSGGGSGGGGGGSGGDGGDTSITVDGVTSTAAAGLGGSGGGGGASGADGNLVGTPMAQPGGDGSGGAGGAGGAGGPGQAIDGTITLATSGTAGAAGWVRFIPLF